MTHIFISYQQADADFALALANTLRAAGFDPWLDLRLQDGEDWHTEIDQAIRSALCLVASMKSQAEASEDVTYQWAYAQSPGVKVIPVGLALMLLHPHPEILQPLDFTSLSTPSWSELIEAVRTAAKAYAPHPASLPQDALHYTEQAMAPFERVKHTNRSEAIQTLVQVDHPLTYEALRGAVQHPIPDVRRQATEALGQLQDAGAVSSLLAALQDPDWGIRRAAALALGQLHDSRAVPGLIAALQDLDVEVREAVTWALEQLREAAVPGLLQTLYSINESHEVHVLARGILERFDTDWVMRRTAAEALSQLHDSRTVPSLLAALQDPDSRVRRVAAQALGQLHDNRAVPGLIAALQDLDWWVRRAAVQALGQLQDARAVSSLLAVLQDPDWESRRAAALALGQLHDSRAVPGLIAALHDLDVDVCEAVTWALEQLREAALPALLDVLHNPAEGTDVHSLVRHILERIELWREPSA
jgi:HEAT repeat protein